MPKYSGSNFTLLLVDGRNLAPAIQDSASISKESLTEQTNPFGVSNESHTPIGIVKAMLVAGGGIYDEALETLHHVTGSVVGSLRNIVAGIEGNTVGALFHGFEGTYSQKFDVMTEADGLTKANVTYLVSGAADTGRIIQDLATFSATWSTATGGANAADSPVDYTTDLAQKVVPITSNSIANPSVVTCPVAHGLTTGQVILISGVASSSPTINGQRTVTVISPTTFSVPVNVTVAGTGGSFVLASTTLGGVGYAQCTQYATLTNVVLKIRHSPDDVTYADLITFSTITAIGGQRATVSGTVDRYLCSTGTVTGSGSATVFSGFCRN
jgi:hypothetical protein